jgi:uncharacterized cupredoxin-like copper-binding protein
MPRRPVLPLAALLAGVALLASACSLPEPPVPSRHKPVPPPSSSTAPRATHRRAGPTFATSGPVRVVMNDRFRYRPDAIVVQAGRRVTFAVTNAGKLPHEFTLGDRATQLAHERQMQDMASSGGHVHGHGPTGGTLTVPPGQTRRLTWTFDKPGLVLYGCHVLGHWSAGMKGTIVVLAPDHPLPADS